MIAIDCSSFSCMSRWTSGRTHVKPEGHTGYNFVSAGNTLCARVALILYVAAWRALRWAIEQPRTSFLPNMPRLQQIWRHMEVYKGIFYMGCFDAPSPKGHMIWSNCEKLVQALVDRAGTVTREQQNNMPTRLARKYVDSHGVRRHAGLKKELRDSQRLGLMPQSFHVGACSTEGSSIKKGTAI
ncbi:unnamed protein product [Effrenium voratum]|nr:unnamed protein product [Effrenium voratum]CAJ1432438.1 unnamed protein product [Effrenium voratum]